jgi:hypothetical protein
MANTKECPQCSTNIQKNEGCNHMTCSRCRFEFCWLCKHPYHQHDTVRCIGNNLSQVASFSFTLIGLLIAYIFWKSPSLFGYLCIFLYALTVLLTSSALSTWCCGTILLLFDRLKGRRYVAKTVLLGYLSGLALEVFLHRLLISYDVLSLELELSLGLQAIASCVTLALQLWFIRQ